MKGSSKIDSRGARLPLAAPDLRECESACRRKGRPDHV